MKLGRWCVANLSSQASISHQFFKESFQNFCNDLCHTSTVNARFLYKLKPAFTVKFVVFVDLRQITRKSDNISGSSTLALGSSKPPSNGRCSISYDGPNVYVLETLVTCVSLLPCWTLSWQRISVATWRLLCSFECSGWEDGDISLLVYKIIAIRHNEETAVDDFIIYRGTSNRYQVPLLYSCLSPIEVCRNVSMVLCRACGTLPSTHISTSTSLQDYLPLGFPGNNYDMVIQILIENQMGTSTVGLNQSVSLSVSSFNLLILRGLKWSVFYEWDFPLVLWNGWCFCIFVLVM